MEFEPYQTAEAAGVPTIRQHSVFVENHVGQLLRLTRLFDQTETRILALSVVNSVDCAICRMILDDPDRGAEVLADAHFPVSESELLVVSLPHGKRGLLHCWTALLNGEINILYTYPLIVHPNGAAAIAIMTDSPEQAMKVLAERNFVVLDQADLLADRLD